jgi:hypothetical protein
MIKSSTSTIREQLTVVQDQLRRTRAEYESIEAERRHREARIAQMQAEALAKVEAAARAKAALAAIQARANAGTNSADLTPRRGGDRGKPRGRPRGRGRGGLREAVLTHSPGRAGEASPTANVGSKSPGPTPPGTPGATGGTPSVTVPTEPVNISVDM